MTWSSLSRRRMLQMAAALAPAAMVPAQGTGSGAQAETDLRPTVSRVHAGPSGKLLYTADAQGNTIPDFSHAGYGGGGKAIPFVPVRETLWPVAGDNVAHLQAAIDRISALPLDADGFRGALLLRAGHYPLAAGVSIRASGVILRGEGMGDTGTILVGTGTGRSPSPTASTTGPGRGQPTLLQVSAARARSPGTTHGRPSQTTTRPSAHTPCAWPVQRPSGPVIPSSCAASATRTGSTPWA